VLAVLADATPPRELPLAGRTFGEAATWLVREGEARGAPSGALRFETPYALPSPALAGGGAFLASRDDARAELARWFANADGLLRAVAGAWPGAVPVRVWPHHFDVGSVLPLAGHDGKHDATVGVGLSPGDEGIPEPYWYVTLWPLPGEPRPELAVGRWHTTAWTGAVLTGSELVAAGNAGAQAGLATRFVSEAIEGMRAWQRGRGR
jgi:hypothetical protein